MRDWRQETLKLDNSITDYLKGQRKEHDVSNKISTK